MRKDLLAGVGVAAAVLGGAAFYYLKERATEEPGFRPLETDGDHQIRDYPPLTVAETVVNGPRRNALDQGFRILADYLFAKSRDGEKLAMTVPVMQDSGDPMARLTSPLAIPSPAKTQSTMRAQLWPFQANQRNTP